MNSQPKNDIEPMPKSIGGFNIRVTPRRGHISLWIGSLLLEIGGNKYS